MEKILQRLEEHYVHAKCSLDYKNPFELLVATILSAQCTDRRVNQVTPSLFQKYGTPEKLAAARPEDVEKLIASTGFFRAKTKSLLGASKAIVERFNGEVPQTLRELVALPGVGRKTANVVLGNAFQKAEGVVVDTHVKRLSYRLGLTRQKTPEKVERELNQKIPPRYWIDLPHWLINHGRLVCTARKPRCRECFLVDLCPQKGVAKRFRSY